MPCFDGVGGVGVKFSSSMGVSVYTICLTFLYDLIGQYDFSINLIKNIFKCLCLKSANLKLHCLLVSGCLFDRLLNEHNSLYS